MRRNGVAPVRTRIPVVLITWCTLVSNAVASVVGRVDVHAGFVSSDGGRARSIRIFVPPDYDAEPERRFPVIYAFDGQDLFDAATAAGGEEWALDELLQARPPGIAPVLVAGIDSRGWLELAPPGSHPQAHVDAFMRFVADEIKPFVDRAYRTQRGPAATFLLGEGLGGLGALYGAWTRPEVFGNAIALGLPDLDAGSLAWSGRLPDSPALRLWIDQRAATAAPRPSTTQLVAALRRGADVQFHVAGSQSSRLVRLAAALRSLCAP
jgi:hypothetical protein